jgi:mycoredoxin
MLNVYATNWCPHSKRMVRFLMDNHIDFVYRDIEHQSKEIVKQVIDANGGRDWVVPTLEFKSKWRPGKTHNDNEIREDLKKMGVIQ